MRTLQPLPLACLLLLALPAAAAPPKNPSGTVEVKARALVLPLLPTSSSEAREHFKEFYGSSTRQMWELEQDLARIYADPRAAKGLPAGFRIPPEQQPEAEFLNALLRDAKYESLEAQVLAAWARWKNVLELASLLGKTEQTTATQESAAIVKKAYDASWSTNTPYRSSDPMKGTLELLGMIAGMDPLNARLSAFGGYAVSISNTTGAELYASEVARIDNKDFDIDATPRIDPARFMKNLNDQMAPECAKAWGSLVDHMNACATQMLDFEAAASPSEPAHMKHLRIRAKGVFLERFRGALWFSRVTWFISAGHLQPMPAPAELRPWVLQGRPLEAWVDAPRQDQISARDGFRLSELKGARIAVWPVESLDLDWDCRGVAKAEYGSLEAFQQALSDRMASQLLPSCTPDSLEPEKTLEALKALDPRASHPAMLLAILRKGGADSTSCLEQIRRQPALQDVRYALFCEELGLERQGFDGEASLPMTAASPIQVAVSSAPTSPRSAAQASLPQSGAVQMKTLEPAPAPRRPDPPTTRGRLRMAVLDLQSGRLVWEGLLHAEVPKDGEWSQAFHEAEQALIQKFLNPVTGS